VKLTPLLIIVVAFLLFLPPGSVIAKTAGVGIYAVVDHVMFEPDSSSPPNFLRISGIFVVPVPLSSGSYKSPQRGYLYFRITPGTEQATRKDWSELKAVAGSGKVVAFGQYWVPNPEDPQGNPHHSLEITVHAEPNNAEPDVYPIPLSEGVIKGDDILRNVSRDPDASKIIAQLQEASRR